MPHSGRIHYDPIPGELERRWCAHCCVLWVGAPRRDGKPDRCIICRDPTELRETFHADGRSELELAGVDFKRQREECAAAHPPPPKPARKRRVK